MKTIQRFLSHIEIDVNGCWLWTRSLNPLGYGRFNLNGKTVQAHRFGYEIYHGEFPKGKVTDHLCRNRKCVNPVHLEAVTQQENISRGNTGKMNATKTHCPYGHELTSMNTRDARKCKECDRIRSSNYRARMKLR